MPGSACELRLRPAAVAFALGKTVELQHDADVVGQQRDLDSAAQPAQAQCDYRLAQLRRGGDVAPRRIKGNVHPSPNLCGLYPWYKKGRFSN
jgi:hypothetical protein